MHLGDETEAHRMHIDPEEGQTVVEVGYGRMLAAEAVNRLADDHLKAPLLRVVQQSLEPRPEATRSADRLVLIGRNRVHFCRGRLAQPYP